MSADMIGLVGIRGYELPDISLSADMMDNMRLRLYTDEATKMGRPFPLRSRHCLKAFLEDIWNGSHR